MHKIGVSRPVRQAAATAFVVAAMILPTMATLWWALSINRPGHVRDVEVRLSRAIGLQVGLEGVAYPRPGEVVFTGVVFRQEEPRGRVFREVARAQTLAMKQADGVVLIETPEIELIGESAEESVAHFERLLKKASLDQSAMKRVNFVADRCRFTLDHGAAGKPVGLDWRLVAGAAELTADQIVVQAGGWSHSGDLRTRCELKMVRKRQGDQASTEIDLATMEGPALPASTLESIFDADDWFGEKARVQGNLHMTRVENQPWEARFAGTLSQVDLSRMVNGRFGLHRLSGTGQLQIRTAHWADRPAQGPGWREIEGDLTAGPGKASHGLLLSMGQQMRFRLANSLHKSVEPGKEIEFGSMGLQFHLTDDGRIRFGGACGPDFGTDVVAVSPHGKPSPIVAAPTSDANVRGLIKTLFPVNLAQTDLLVPTTRESQSFQRWLPMPAADPERAAVLPATHESGIIRR